MAGIKAGSADGQQKVKTNLHICINRIQIKKNYNCDPNSSVVFGKKDLKNSFAHIRKRHSEILQCHFTNSIMAFGQPSLNIS